VTNKVSDNLLDKNTARLYSKQAMIAPITVTTRDMLRNYRDVIEKVKRTKQPAVVVSDKKPQVAIVSLEDLRKLEMLGEQASAKRLLEMAKRVRVLLKDEHLPADLSARHDDYLWQDDA
jgi:PHD/YefM family antitoxin component YafN of YafNO toxin-antitoxin module